MRSSPTHTPWPVLLIVAMGSLLVLATPASACQTDGSLLAWNRCWSVSRFLLAGGIAVGTALVVFYVYFPFRIRASNPDPPWPRSAYGFCLAWWWVISGLAAVALFTFPGTVRGELRYPLFRLGDGAVLIAITEYLLPGLLAAAVVVIGILIGYIVRHRTT